MVTLDNDPVRNRELWEEDGLAPLTWYYPVSKARSTAEVLLAAPDRGQRLRPARAAGHHVLPAGRTAFLATDETALALPLLETWRELSEEPHPLLALNKLRRSDYRFDLATDPPATTSATAC